MIDFQNASFMKLKPVSNDSFSSLIAPMLVDGEQIISTFQGIRDGVVFRASGLSPSMYRESPGRKKTSPPYHIARCRLFLLKPQVLWIWIVSLNFGSPAWERLSWSL